MKYKVFFNQDCMMYGVHTLKSNINYMGDSERWGQVLPPKGKGARHGKSAYTYYRGVAERWAKQLEKESAQQ